MNPGGEPARPPGPHPSSQGAPVPPPDQGAPKRSMMKRVGMAITALGVLALLAAIVLGVFASHRLGGEDDSSSAMGQLRNGQEIPPNSAYRLQLKSGDERSIWAVDADRAVRCEYRDPKGLAKKVDPSSRSSEVSLGSHTWHYLGTIRAVDAGSHRLTCPGGPVVVTEAGPGGAVGTIFSMVLAGLSGVGGAILTVVGGLLWFFGRRAERGVRAA